MLLWHNWSCKSSHVPAHKMGEKKHFYKQVKGGNPAAAKPPCLKPRVHLCPLWIHMHCKNQLLWTRAGSWLTAWVVKMCFTVPAWEVAAGSSLAAARLARAGWEVMQHGAGAAGP